MADFIYGADGAPRGFRLSNYIYTLDGVPVGRVFAEKAYRLDGSYVGAMINSMVVDKPDVSRQRIAAVAGPERAAPARSEHRRSIGPHHPDCFDDLLPAVRLQEDLLQADHQL
jgi:hypothetical protein